LFSPDSAFPVQEGLRAIASTHLHIRERYILSQKIAAGSQQPAAAASSQQQQPAAAAEGK